MRVLRCVGSRGEGFARVCYGQEGRTWARVQAGPPAAATRQKGRQRGQGRGGTWQETRHRGWGACGNAARAVRGQVPTTGYLPP